jgi:hypothetical protein
MARSFYHLSILVLVSILLRPSPLPSKLFCLLELTQPAEFGGEVMCTAVLWPYRAIFMSDFFLEQLRLENLVACKWKMLNMYIQVSQKWRTNGALRCRRDYRKRQKNVKKILLNLFSDLAVFECGT